MSNNTLKIRIQIQQPARAIDEIYPDLPESEIVDEQSLDWKKIIAALSLLFIILGITGYLLSDPGNNEKPSSEAITSINPVLHASVNTDSPEVSETLSDSEAMPIPESRSVASAEVLMKPSVPTDPEDITAAAEDQSVDKHTSNPAFGIAEQQPPIDSTKIPKTATQSKPRKAADHPKVLRVGLTSAIREREPVDDIHEIQLRPEESKFVHFYLHLKDLQGTKIRIDWYHNDKLDSQLVLQVNNDNWRTHAKKQLNTQRMGTWRVELIDELGNLLAARPFTVLAQ